MELYFRGDSIPTDGSGRLLITDISLHNEQTSTSDEDALLCVSSGNIAEIRPYAYDGDWYLDPTTANRSSGMKISMRGGDTMKPLTWRSNRVKGWAWGRNNTKVNGYYHCLVGLKRASETAVEGKFTCHIRMDNNNNRFLLILYPSEYISNKRAKCIHLNLYP